jgi:hypothetical protein
MEDLLSAADFQSSQIRARQKQAKSHTHENSERVSRSSREADLTKP